MVLKFISCLNNKLIGIIRFYNLTLSLEPLANECFLNLNLFICLHFIKYNLNHTSAAASYEKNNSVYST